VMCPRDASFNITFKGTSSVFKVIKITLIQWRQFWFTQGRHTKTKSG